MSSKDFYVDALKRLCDSLGGPGAVSRATDLSAENIKQILKGTPLPSGNPRGVGPALRRRLDEVFPGWSDASDDHKSSHQAVRKQSVTSDIVIPQYDAGGSMGGGKLLLADQPGLIKSWHVDHEWVRLNVKHYTSLSNLCIVTGFGNSMKPMFNPGDPLLIDRGVNIIDHEGIFFFRIGENGYIKQMQRIPDPKGADLVYRAKSMNTDYDPFDIHPENPHFAVLGKVLTVWKSDQF